MGSEIWKWIKEIWRRVPKVAVIILLLLIVTAIFADFLALHDPEIGDPRQRLLPPAWEQEENGHILWVRIPWGGMYSAG